jgi:hypothetical protein
MRGPEPGIAPASRRWRTERRQRSDFSSPSPIAITLSIRATIRPYAESRLRSPARTVRTSTE